MSEPAQFVATTKGRVFVDALLEAGVPAVRLEAVPHNGRGLGENDAGAVA